MYTVISCSVTYPEKKPVFSCIVVSEVSKAHLSLIIPLSRAKTKEDIKHYIAEQLEVPYSEVAWREGLEIPQIGP